jgi:hypothetical protein
MDAVHKEIIIWALSNETVRQQFVVHLEGVLGVSEEALDKILEELENKKHTRGLLWGTDGFSHTVREFDTFAEMMAYDYGTIDTEDCLKCRELEEDEIAFLEDCNPSCKDCETKDPRKFEAFALWKKQRDSEDGVELILDKCDACRKLDGVKLEAQRWHFSKEQGGIVRAVYTAVADQYDMIGDEPHFIPCLAIEGEKGYYPMRGSGEGATPWYWGETYEECQKTCDIHNEFHFGISPREAAIIVAGTMRN